MSQNPNENKLFGFSYKRDDDAKPLEKLSPVPPNADDGVAVAAGGLYGYGVDFDQATSKDYDLIRRYRCMALHPEVDSAIEDIINEAIVSDTNDTPVKIDLSNLEVSQRIKTIIREEFQYILHLLDYNNKCHEMFRRWYIDGRLYYHKVIDIEHPERGLTDIRNIDALKIKPVREFVQIPQMPQQTRRQQDQPFSNKDNQVFSGKTIPSVEEYFLYNKRGINYMGRGAIGQQNGQNQNTVKIAKDAVTYVTSGLVDGNNGQVLSYLNKTIKALNQLRWMEDAIVIYRMARAPERRLFYIDVGNLPKHKAESYLRDVMARYRTKISYDQQTGEIRDEKKHMSMLEDYWLPRREGGRGTEVSTLPGGQNLGELTDLEYFKDKLYKSLNVPTSRMDGDGGFQIGKSDSVLRDEVKFAKFVGRMRKKFSYLFTDLLKSQLILKGVVSPKEYDQMKEHIQFDFIYDNHFSELKDMEMLQNKIQVAQMCEPYVGKYFSVYQLRHDVLGFSDGEIAETDKQIAYEKNVGIIQDPSDQAPPGAEEEATEATGEEAAGEDLSTEMQGGGVPDGDLDLSGDPETQLPPELLQMMSNSKGAK